MATAGFPLKALFCEDRGHEGYHIESGFATFEQLQWMENLSDRELERFLPRKML